MDTRQRISTALRSGAAELHVPGPGPDVARHRAHQRARRRHAAAGGLGALAVLAGGLATVANLPTSSRTLEFLSPGAALDATPLRLDWRDADATVGYSQRQLVAADGQFYALSTAPGTRSEDFPGGDAPQALYRSADGLAWETAGLGDQPWVSDLGERDGTVYALSTAPATRGGNGQAALSFDGGDSWEHIDLPSTAVPPDAAVPLALGGVTARLAVGEDLLLATLTTRYVFDESALFTPDELSGDATYWAALPEGIGLFQSPCGGRQLCGRDEEPQRVRTIGWAELGLGGPDDLTVQELFLSPDGRTWQAVPSPFTGRVVSEVAATAHGFFALTYPVAGEGELQVLRSADGLTWEPLDSSPARAWSFGFAGTRLVALGGDWEPGSLTTHVSDDGGATWSTTNLAPLVDPDSVYEQLGTFAFDSGPLGTALVVAGYRNEDSRPDLSLLVTRDGMSWSPIALDGAAGELAITGVNWLIVGADAVVMSVTTQAGPDGPPTMRTVVGTPAR